MSNETEDTGDLAALFATNKNKEKDGVWVPMGPSAQFLLARAGGSNTRYLNAAAAAGRPHERRIRLNLMDAAEARNLAIGPFVDTVLLDWKDVKVKGEIIPYSKEAAKKLLTDMPDLFDALNEQAQSVANFQGYVEEAAKN